MANEQGLVERLRAQSNEMCDSWPELSETNDRAASALEAQTAELAELRAIISQVCEALGNGAFCSPDCTVGFMKEVPNEVRLVVGGLRERAISAEAARDRARNDALEEAAKVADLEKAYCRDRANKESLHAKETYWLGCGDTAGKIATNLRHLKTEDSAG